MQGQSQIPKTVSADIPRMSLQVPSEGEKSASEEEAGSAPDHGTRSLAVSSATSFSHNEQGRLAGNESVSEGGGVVLDAEREVRVKLYIGQVFFSFLSDQLTYRAH